MREKRSLQNCMYVTSECSCLMQVKVVLTANHVGDFQFKLCPHNNPKERVSPQCLDQHVLTLAGTNEHRYLVSSMQWEHEIDLQLPPEVVCTQCVLQWTYTTGRCVGIKMSVTGKSPI